MWIDVNFKTNFISTVKANKPNMSLNYSEKFRLIDANIQKQSNLKFNILSEQIFEYPKWDAEVSRKVNLNRKSD